MSKLGFVAAIVAFSLSCCSSALQTTKYYFYEENGSYDQCEFDGYINGKLESDKKPQPYFSVRGHGFEKKINGLWYPHVYQWRGKNGRTITFVVRDGTGAVGQWGYWYGTLNGERAGGFTLVPRYHWVFNTWDGSAEFECDNPGEDD